MKKSRFTEPQIIRMLQSQQEGKKVAEICREYGISEQTFYNWKSKYGGMSLSELQRVKELEAENARLKRIVADQQISIDILKEVNSKKVVTPYQKERCIAYIREKIPEISYAKVCRVMGRSRTSKYYKKRMPEKDEKLREAITSILGTSRLGRKKVIVKVRKKYPGYGSSQIRRVYQKYGFSLYKRMKRKRFDNPANPIAVPLERNEEWAMDFMSDALARGSRFRTLNIVDQYNRKCLGIDARTSMPSRAVIHFLERMIEKHGKPKGIRTDNGPEFTSGLF